MQSFILIGGSPSTGSSLLRQILNRHSEINCAPETHLFCKPELYENWSSKKFQVQSLKSRSIHPKRGLETSELHVDNRLFKSLLRESESFQEFAQIFIKKFYADKDCKYIAEKTPCNANCASQFLSTFNDARFIHIVRNPYDAIASLILRGYDPVFATMRYLFNASHGLEVKNHENYFQIKYEDLVGNPKVELKKLFAFLSLEFEENVLTPTNTDKNTITQLAGWKYDETKSIASGSIGRFAELEEQLAFKVKVACISLVLDLPNKYTSVSQICEELEYRFMRVKFIKDWRNPLWSHRLKSSFNATPYHFFNYPFQWKK